MDQIRAFIAIRLSADIRHSLASVENRLMVSGADIKWVSEANFHITLKFLGNIASDRLGAICEAVEAAVTGTPAFQASLTGVGAFPNTRRPNVVWVGIREGGDKLKDLAERIECATEPLGFKREAKAFSPHITIGRSRSLRGIDCLKDLIEQLHAEPFGTIHVDSVAVMESDLRSNGPLYSALAEFPLTAIPEEG